MLWRRVITILKRMVIHSTHIHKHFNLLSLYPKWLWSVEYPLLKYTHVHVDMRTYTYIFKHIVAAAKLVGRFSTVSTLDITKWYKITNLDIFLLWCSFLTVLCYLMRYKKVNQPYVYMYPFPFESPSHLHPHPTPLGWYRALVWVSWAIQQIPIGYPFS